MDLAFFNVNNGFNEALLRGLRSGFLTPDDYKRMEACESVEDVRSVLEDTEYGSFLQDEAAPIAVSTLTRKCKERLAEEFRFMRAQAVEPLSTFLDHIACEKMIDNVVNLIQGTVLNKSAADLLGRTDPLGDFEEMKTIPTLDLAAGYDDIYKTILIDTPVGPYFEDFLRSLESANGEGKSFGDVSALMGEQDLEMMKTVLKKSWLEHFHTYTQSLGGATASVMGDLLKTEADHQVLKVTLNTLNTALSGNTKLQERNALYPSFGHMYPDPAARIRAAFNDATIRAALECTPYISLYDTAKGFYDKDSASTRDKTDKIASVEDLLYVESCQRYELVFEQQYQFGIFYAWVKLKQQEIRNLEWICNMMLMGKKDQMDQIVPIFAPRTA